MKDLYSFDECTDTARISYEKVAEAYSDIFTKLEVPFAVVLR